MEYCPDGDLRSYLQRKWQQWRTRCILAFESTKEIDPFSKRELTIGDDRLCSDEEPPCLRRCLSCPDLGNGSALADLCEGSLPNSFHSTSICELSSKRKEWTCIESSNSGYIDYAVVASQPLLEWPLTDKEMLGMADQIAQGMSWLCSQKVRFGSAPKGGVKLQLQTSLTFCKFSILCAYSFFYTVIWYVISSWGTKRHMKNVACKRKIHPCCQKCLPACLQCCTISKCVPWQVIKRMCCSVQFLFLPEFQSISCY